MFFLYSFSPERKPNFKLPRLSFLAFLKIQSMMTPNFKIDYTQYQRLSKTDGEEDDYV